MIQDFLILLAAQGAGEMIVAGAGLPAPGMVVGLALLFAAIAARGRLFGPARAVPSDLASAAQGLHAHLGLLFVPAGVGIVAHVDLLASEGIAILAAVIGSTALGIATGAAIAALRPRATAVASEAEGTP